MYEEVINLDEVVTAFVQSGAEARWKGQEEACDQGGHKKIKLWKKKHHGPLQLKSERRFKGIIPSIRFWVI